MGSNPIARFSLCMGPEGAPLFCLLSHSFDFSVIMIFEGVGFNLGGRHKGIRQQASYIDHRA